MPLMAFTVKLDRIDESLLFEVPERTKRIELWLYRDKRQPRLLKTLPNPCPKPLSEVLANLPPANWEEAE